MKRVVILGASGHAHVIADIVRACNDEVIAFLDDDVNAQDRCGSISDYEKYKDCEFVIGIGNANTRKRLSELPVRWYIAIHPSAIISESASIREGTVVMPNVVINAGAQIGRHCILNTCAVIEHENIIEDFAHISVGAKLGGNVHIGKSTWLGIGATVSNNIEICNDCMIGAGAVVVKDLTESGTYYGVPARLKVS